MLGNSRRSPRVTKMGLPYVVRDVLKAVLELSQGALASAPVEAVGCSGPRLQLELEKNIMSVYRGIVTRFLPSLSDRAARD
jgi:hypothetical protein